MTRLIRTQSRNHNTDRARSQPFRSREEKCCCSKEVGTRQLTGESCGVLDRNARGTVIISYGEDMLIYDRVGRSIKQHTTYSKNSHRQRLHNPSRL